MKSRPRCEFCNQVDCEPCINCGGPGCDSWFDRTVCPEPCGDMHYICNNCSWPVDSCPLIYGRDVYDADPDEDSLAALIWPT